MNEANQAQIDCWNGRAGQKWAAMQVRLDRMLTDATAELQRRAGPVAGLRVLDIGCGTGETCALLLEGGAEVTGVDVSEPMLAVAERRAGGAGTFVVADASVWKSDVPFDLAVSRFGLMFFADPEAAFATIAANLVPGGRLLFNCWRDRSENGWVRTPMAAIEDLLPGSSPSPPGAPGPFALADRERLSGVLEQAGFTDVTIDAFDFPVRLTSDGGLEEAVELAMKVGPSGAALAGADPEVTEAAAERLAAALAAHERDGQVTLGGACWLVDATRS